MRWIKMQIDGIEQDATVIKEYSRGSKYQYTINVSDVSFKFQYESVWYMSDAERGIYTNGFLFKNNKFHSDCRIKFIQPPKN